MEASLWSFIVGCSLMQTAQCQAPWKRPVSALLKQMLVLALPGQRGLLGLIACDISMLEADGWWCLQYLSPTPGSLGRFDISLINDLITAEALKGARRQAWIPNVRAKLAGNTMWRDFLPHAVPHALPFSLCLSHLLKSAQCELYSTLRVRNKLQS